jgi:phosphoribosylanthranilate isomerase
MKLKVCGMKDVKNITEVAVLNPDYIGFIFYTSSPRYVGLDFRSPSISTSIKRVGVFVDETLEFMLYTAEKYNLKFIQLHGSESPDDCLSLKKKNLSVIKTFSMSDDFNFNVLELYKPAVDFFLFDTKGKLPGGNGHVFNWSILEKYDQQIPFFLSGGIGFDQLKDLHNLKHMNMHALDLNSGVEIEPGIKSLAKITDIKKTLSQSLTPNP